MLLTCPSVLPLRCLKRGKKNLGLLGKKGLLLSAFEFPLRRTS